MKVIFENVQDCEKKFLQNASAIRNDRVFAERERTVQESGTATSAE